MCFPMTKCFFCLELETATKIIGIVYLLVSASTLVLFSVPLALVVDTLPKARQVFYGAMALSSAALFFSSGLLLYASMWKIPRLLWPWISSAWCTGSLLAVTCIGGLVTVSFRAQDVQAAAAESYVISVYFVHAMLLLYFASVINSRRRDIILENQHEANHKLMYPTMYNIPSV